MQIIIPHVVLKKRHSLLDCAWKSWDFTCIKRQGGQANKKIAKKGLECLGLTTVNLLDSKFYSN